MDGCLTCDQWRSRPEYVLTETISVALWKHFGEQLQKVASRELPIGTLRPEMVALGFLCWLSHWESPEGTKPEENSFLIKPGSFEAKLEVLLLEAFPCGCAGLVGWFRLRQGVWLWQWFRFRLIFWAIHCMVTKI